MTKREFFFSFFSLSFNFLLDVVQLIDVQLKLEGRTKEITTKRKKDREVNWRERKRRKRIAIRFTRNMWKLCFFFLPPFLSSPPHAGSGDRRIPLSVSSDVKRMKASRLLIQSALRISMWLFFRCCQGGLVIFDGRVNVTKLSRFGQMLVT